MKLDCYIVKDLLPSYVDKLTSDETCKDIEEHLKECKNCNKEFEQMIKPMSVSNKEKQDNTKEVHYFRKCKKKYSTMVKLLIIIAVICVLLFTGLVITLTWAYHQQYNNNAVSNYLSISIEENESIDFIGEYDDYKVYTYKLKEAYFIDFFANRIEIKDALEKGKISLKDMTKHLELVNEENGNRIYEFENYQIIFSKEICVIAPLSIKGEVVIKTVEGYIAE
ncbi:zf-HC2 domain-containing protein [Clostridium sp.]|uniref:zf-HC2 domain-containing protein n=1 Tax=Clostridium sp. TaxID=1506 RepID=UPI00321630A5